MVGADASGIEARSLGHYIYKYTGGQEYVDLILNGDIHTYNQKNLGLVTNSPISSTSNPLPFNSSLT